MTGSMWVTYIYGLVDPRDRRVRYVGQSQDPDRRYREHLRAGLRLSNVFGQRSAITGRYLGYPLPRPEPVRALAGGAGRVPA